MFRRPLVAFDGSDPSRRALEKAIELAALFDVPLRLITVYEGLPDHIHVEAIAASDATVIEEVEQREEAARATMLRDCRSQATALGVELIAETIDGDAVDTIVDAVDRHGCDLLIVGLRRHPGLIERLTSRTAQTLTERAGCSVLGVR